MADRILNPNAGLTPVMRDMASNPGGYADKLLELLKTDNLSMTPSSLTTTFVKCLKNGAEAHGVAHRLEEPLTEAAQSDAIIQDERSQKLAAWRSVKTWAEADPSGIKFVPIIYTWLLTTSHLAGEADNFGGVVFVDSGLQRVLSVNYYDDRDYAKYDALNDIRARQIMGTLMSLGVSDIKWVRSTYILAPPGGNRPRTRVAVSPTFLRPIAVLDSVTTEPNAPPRFAPVLHPTPSTVVPVLKTSDFTHMEGAIAEAGGLDQKGGPSGRVKRRKDQLMAGGNQCDVCEKSVDNLLRCSSCKLAYY